MVRHRGMGIPMVIARALTFKKEEGRPSLMGKAAAAWKATALEA